MHAFKTSDVSDPDTRRVRPIRFASVIAPLVQLRRFFSLAVFGRDSGNTVHGNGSTVGGSSHYDRSVSVYGALSAYPDGQANQNGSSKWQAISPDNK